MMINIVDKIDCCGCGSCAQICPKQCIALAEDKEGFLYPHVDLGKCIGCGLCKKVCPCIQTDTFRKTRPLKALACKNPDKDIQLNSSSGGIVSLLAQKVIEQGGFVFGAKFNEEWGVVHGYTSDMEGLLAFRGSKYVQSRIGDSYRQAKGKLDDGSLVLFIGTPCQIKGLYCFLQKDYENLLTIDLVCHGVGSPKVWRTYLKQYFSNVKIKTVEHRNKTLGWENYCLKVTYEGKDGNFSCSCENLRKNPYLRGFIRNIFIRPSCTNCISKGFKSGSDFTCGDFWGVKNTYPDLYDKDGVSLLTLNSEKAISLFNELGLCATVVEFDKVCKYNTSFYVSVEMSHFRALFFSLLGKVNFKCLIFLLLFLNKMYRMTVKRFLLKKLS